MSNIILPEVPSFSATLGRNLGQGFSHGVDKAADIYKRLAFNNSRQKTEKLEEKRRGYEVGLGTLESMRNLIPKLGPLEGIMSPLKSRADRQSYTTYANSLLGILSTIPVRNKKEFEAVKKALSNPWATQNEIESAVNSAEDIMTRHMESLSSDSRQHSKKVQSQKSKIPNLKRVSSGTALNREIVETLRKRSGGNKQKAMQLARELGYDVD